MESNTMSQNNYAACLSQLLEREPSLKELDGFKGNQDLMKITRREPQNSAYLISFVNATKPFAKSYDMLQGDALELHSYEDNHRFYSVQLEGLGNADDSYLILDATIENVMLNGTRKEVVLCVRLISIEEFITLYSPVTYALA